MNTIRDYKARVRDYTQPLPRGRSKGIRTLTESGGLFFALGAIDRKPGDPLFPRLRTPRGEK